MKQAIGAERFSKLVQDYANSRKALCRSCTLSVRETIAPA